MAMTNERVVFSAEGTAELFRKCFEGMFPIKPKKMEEGFYGTRAIPTHVMVPHCLYVAEEIKQFIKDGRREKAMRWLGWLQGVACAYGAATLDDVKNLSKPSIVRITKSPNPSDEQSDPAVKPWEYEEDAFCLWVFEVFLEGYKHTTMAVPTLAEGLQILRDRGYQVTEER